MMGRGWLIAPDVIFTIGHMSFDWDHELDTTDVAMLAKILYNVVMVILLLTLPNGLKVLT